MITIDYKIDTIEALIESFRWARNEEPTSAPRQTLEALRAIASDLRARKASAPSLAEAQLERRMRGVQNAKARGDDTTGAVLSLGNETIGRWPTIRQALELFGATLEQTNGDGK